MSLSVRRLFDTFRVAHTVARGMVVAGAFLDPIQDAECAKRYQGGVPLLRPVQRRIAPKDSIGAFLRELDTGCDDRPPIRSLLQKLLCREVCLAQHLSTSLTRRNVRSNTSPYHTCRGERANGGARLTLDFGVHF